MGRTNAATARAGIALDAGALISLDRGDKRLMLCSIAPWHSVSNYECLQEWWGKFGGMAVFRSHWRGFCRSTKSRLSLSTNNSPAPAGNSAAPPKPQTLSMPR